MRRLLLLAAVLVLASGTSALAETWWYDYQANHPTAFTQTPAHVNNINGDTAFYQKYTDAGVTQSWENLGGGNWSFRLNKPSAGSSNIRWYWDGDDFVDPTTYKAMAPTGSRGYTFDTRMKVNSITADATQNNALAWFLGYQKLTDVPESMKVRLYASDRTKQADGTGTGWGSVTPGTYYIYDDDMNNGADYMKANWAITQGDWFTLRYAIWTPVGATTSNVNVWLNGTLVANWTDKPIVIGAGDLDAYFGYNDRKKCTADIEWDYVRWANVAYDLDGNIIPEPGSMLALVSGLVGLGGAAWRRRKP